MKNLTVSLIQCPLVWENTEANRQQFERRLAIAADGEVLLDAQDVDGIFTAVLDADRQKNYRQKSPSHLDGDDFTLVV